MVLLDICDIPVEFPFQPYDSQVIYMEKVIMSLKNKQNAILESPTGTGKTLCLLCATLAWRRHLEKTIKPRSLRGTLKYEGADDSDNDDYYSNDTKNTQEEDPSNQLPRIIYSSRTHSQLKQVVKELKNTSYSPKIANLGSREHLCVNPKININRGTKLNLACRVATRAQKCSFKRGYDTLTKHSKKPPSLPIMDIEELTETMKEKEVCPFYLSRSMLADAEILFVPYNYLIDPIARSSIGISIENAVLIFDEAHNVESIASEAASYTISSNDIGLCINEVQNFLGRLNEGRIELPVTSNLSSASVQTLRALLQEIEKGLNNFPLSSSGGFTKPGEFIFEFFQQFNVNFETCPLVLNMIEEIIDFSSLGDENNRASNLDSLLSFLSTIFRNRDTHMKVVKNYRVHIQETHERPTQKRRGFNALGKTANSTRVFNYWCFHPGVSFKEIYSKSVYNIILTSGTLSPLETTIKELGLDFPVRLENSHVIDPTQVLVGVVSTGVTGKRLNSSYNFRSSDEYLLELGNTIVNFTRIVPNGLLVFFPSYSILEESIERWQKPSSNESTETIWERIMNLKEVFVEPRARMDFKQVVDEYHETIREKPQGAVFFAVCRGKVSEGIDFSNEKGRAVVITGLPFPPTKDPKIMLKKSILDEAIVPPGEMKLTGNHWYVQQASRAVNQAIGRVIRHRHDYGAILLCDERFALQQQQQFLSKWLQPYCRNLRNYGEAHIGLMRFFKHNKQSMDAINVSKKLAAMSSESKGIFTPPKMAGLKVNKAFTPPKTVIDLASQDSSKNDSSPTTKSSLDTVNTSVSVSAQPVWGGEISGIGDGQSYVRPELLRRASEQPIKQDSTASNIGNSFASTVAKLRPSVPAANRKRTLGAILSSSKTSMVTSTSSISRPFVPPKQIGNDASSPSNATINHENEVPGDYPEPKAQAEEKLFKPSWMRVKGSKITSGQTGKNVVDADHSKEEAKELTPDQMFILVFPRVSRKLLPGPEVDALFSCIKSLPQAEPNEIDFILTKICEMVSLPERKDLLDLLPKVLGAKLSERFLQKAKSVGLEPGEFHLDQKEYPLKKSTITSFFERLDQKRRKTNHQQMSKPATYVEDPQCLVCFEIPRKAFAAECGHICCLDCWKKMEKDGTSTCPLCKISFKMDRLSLIRAQTKQDIPT